MSSDQFSSTAALDKNQCITKLKTHEVIFNWVVEDFDFHEARGEDLKSPTFSAITNDEYKWSLVLEPNGENDSITKENISIYLDLMIFEGLATTSAQFFINFFKQEQEVESYSAISRGRGGWKYFVSKKLALFDNKVKIRCRVTFSIENDVSSNLVCQNKLKPPECNLSENLASLFENRELSDVTISIKSKDYPVHKCILAARSPVFAAMFRHDTKENQLNRVSIEDIDENVMDEMLKYIYGGRCENLDSLAAGLLAAADKYALDRLKIICSKKLQESLSVENVANILLLSEMHSDNELKDRAITFIVGKTVEVIATDGWKDVLFFNPHLVSEVCLAMYSYKRRIV